MTVEKRNLQFYFLYVSMFFAFTGSYAVRLLLEGRITLPGGIYRAIVLLSLLGLFMITDHKKLDSAKRFFLLFSTLYIIRLIIEILYNKTYSEGPDRVFIHFFVGAFLPFLLLSKVRLEGEHYNAILKTILLSGILFSTATFISYGQFIGHTGRLTSRVAGDEAVGPLVLSYCASMTLGVGVAYLLENKVKFWNRVYLIAVIGISFVPLLLGASRGSILSLFFPLILFLSFRRGVKNNVKVFLSVLLLIVGLVWLSSNVGSALVDRFVSLESDIEESSSSASRLGIWKQALSQFVDNPLFGDGLRTEGHFGYPHNLFVETLLTTGIVGFIPMLLAISMGFLKAIRIFKYNPAYSWVGILFLQCFMQSMFSFSIYSNKWIWLSLILLLAFDISKERLNVIGRSDLRRMGSYR